MSLIDRIGFSKSMYNLNNEISNSKHLQYELLTGHLSVFRNTEQYKCINKLSSDISKNRRLLKKICDLQEFVKANQKGLEMLSDILDTMIDMTQDAGVSSKDIGNITEYNRHLIYLKSEFYSVAKTFVYKNRSVFKIVTDELTGIESYNIDDNLKWDMICIADEGNTTPIPEPGLSLEKIKLDNNCIISYKLGLSDEQYYIYNSNMLVLKKNKERIEINKNKVCQIELILNMRKNTVQRILENLVKQQQSIKDINNINFNKELCESQQTISNAKKMLSSIYLNNKNRSPNI